MKKYPLFLLLLTTLLITIPSCCKNSQCPWQEDEQNAGLTSSVKGDVYHAVVPCASCPGIDIWVQLYTAADGMRFRIVERYLEEDNAVFIDEGGVTRKNETIIELQRKDGAQSYLLGDGYISLLGTMDVEEGSITDNADYRLYKMPAGFKMP
ncbi:MAG: hypothetical protein CSA81_14915 [Acidobacteria bacterium]|nr:MAG: hypothetical protein CSA81_14915 [Acidobacteriota bacterium]